LSVIYPVSHRFDAKLQIHSNLRINLYYTNSRNQKISGKGGLRYLRGKFDKFALVKKIW